MYKGYKVYVDLDGVLCNFEERFKEYSNGKSFKDYLAANGQAAYNLISKAGKSFWSGMEWTKDGKQLWDFIKQYDPYILTSPGKFLGAEQGKVEWCLRELGIPASRVILRQAAMKREFADPKSILVDDYGPNIRDWSQDGGIAVRYTEADKAIKELEEL